MGRNNEIMEGIEVKRLGDKTSLYLNGIELTSVSPSNLLGLYTFGNKLMLDGATVVEGSDTTGITIKNDELYFGGNKVTNSNGGTNEPATSFWNPPTQPVSTYKPWSYKELIQEYDKLMANSNGYMKKIRYEKNGSPILTKNGNYELFHYVLEPKNYKKTVYVQAGIHGNEMDAKQQLLKITDILVNKTNQKGYTVFKPLRENIRFVFVPCVSPWGHDNSTMNIPYQNEERLNLNRNCDFNQQQSIPADGVGGYSPFDVVETQHIRDIAEKVKAENLNYAMDWHDGGAIKQHYWVNFAVDNNLCREKVLGLINHLVKKYNIENPVIPNCKDTSTTGITSMYFAKSLGVPASTIEWLGGYLGYDFGSKQMTKSLEVRGNMLLIASNYDFGSWEIGEKENAEYFQFDFPKAFTKKGLRKDEADERTVVTDQEIYNRWDKLQQEYPSLIKKSERLGRNTTNTQDVFTYTFGNGKNKVLYVGGVMRYGGTHKIDEFAIYQLVEYLCNEFTFKQSKFLKDLRENYKIIILPCIDNIAANSPELNACGLNNQLFDFKKWEIKDGICKPTEYAVTQAKDIPILKKVIDSNQDLKCIISGGEILTGYKLNDQDYTTNYQTQFVIPKNFTITKNLNKYKEYLEKERAEHVVIENTKGITFGDYAWDNYKIPTCFIQLKNSNRWEELKDYHTLSKEDYMYNNYEAGRRFANIANLFINFRKEE